MNLVINHLEDELIEKEVAMTAWIIENDDLLPEQYPDLEYIKQLRRAIEVLKRQKAIPYN